MHEWGPWCETHLITDPDRMFADSDYLISVLESVEGQSAPTLGSPPGEPKWKLVVAEDADPYLRSTARFDAGAALGRLLNATDGLLGQSTKTLVLLTTNEELTRLQPALIRPGRCLTGSSSANSPKKKPAPGWETAGRARFVGQRWPSCSRQGVLANHVRETDIPLGPTCDVRQPSGLLPISAAAAVAPFVPSPKTTIAWRSMDREHAGSDALQSRVTGIQALAYVVDVTPTALITSRHSWQYAPWSAPEREGRSLKGGCEPTPLTTVLSSTE